MAIPTFESTTITLACTSDTHNEDARDNIPAADVFLHAGDMTDDGTLDELTTAFSWIASLPHKVKVLVAGNHDLGLDRSHEQFSQQAYDLFTGEEATKHGIVYLDRETKAIAQCRDDAGILHPITVYGNPCQPVFLKSNYAFTYLPYPDKSSEAPWEGAPTRTDGVTVWVCHSPPEGILDAIPLPGLKGCAVMLEKVKEAVPQICVFGHYHTSYGKKLMIWKGNKGEEDNIEATEDGILDLSQDRHRSETAETLFLNAAWMTMWKTKVDKRNPPWLVKLKVDGR